MPCDNVVGGNTSIAICAKGSDGGNFFPILPDWEESLPLRFRAALYLVILVWFFVGVGIVSEIFMGAIEWITSERRLYDLADGRKKTQRVWNSTVANLTLMALGSSAPEILLNVIAVIPTFQSSPLGPSVIVGSAAFNLLCIMAVCMVAIPKDRGTLKIKFLGVYTITASFSILAYLWLLLILLVFTPHMVTFIEGVLTFAFFWVLVGLAYLADVNATEDKIQLAPDTSVDELAWMEVQVRKKYGKHRLLTPDETAELMYYMFPPSSNKAKYRIDASRRMTGGARVVHSNRFQQAEERAKQLLQESEKAASHRTLVEDGKVKISFIQNIYNVLESVGYWSVVVVSMGMNEGMAPVEIDYATRDGTAKEGDDYIESRGTLVFAPGSTEQTITVQIVTSAEREDTEHFFVELKDPQNDTVIMGTKNVATVTIIDEGCVEQSNSLASKNKKLLEGEAGVEHGVIVFEKEQDLIKAADHDKDYVVKLRREGGCFGEISCTYSTECYTARGGKDYVETSGTLNFRHKEVERNITVQILRKSPNEKTESFRINLSNPGGGARFDPEADGGPDTAIMTITILAEQDDVQHLKRSHTMWQRLKSALVINSDLNEEGRSAWKANIEGAFYVLGSPNKNADDPPASFGQKVGHAISFPWKILFALIPPNEYLNGWLCFVVALLTIGVLTAFIADLAELIGCCMEISEATTAITIVALGTSLPDTFASRLAAQMEPYADNSIGNVTGSNSVNVFLGLGLPWMICSIYWTFLANCTPGDAWSYLYPVQAKQYNSGVFVVEAGGLSTSVGIFSLCAFFAIGLLAVRRYFLGGELGGDPKLAWASSAFLVSLWVAYITLSILMEDND